MKINLGTIIIALYVKKKSITFQEARKYLKYIHIKHARGKIDSKMAHSMTIKVLSSLVPYYPIKIDIKSFNIEKTLITLLAGNKKITLLEAREWIIYLELERIRNKINCKMAYKYTLQALGSLVPHYLDEVAIYE